jgi:hypothetical protein
MATNMNIKLALGLMTSGLTSFLNPILFAICTSIFSKLCNVYSDMQKRAQDELLYLDICDVMEINGGQTYHSECNVFIFMFQQLQSLGELSNFDSK